MISLNGVGFLKSQDTDSSFIALGSASQSMYKHLHIFQFVAKHILRPIRFQVKEMGHKTSLVACCSSRSQRGGFRPGSHLLMFQDETCWAPDHISWNRMKVRVKGISVKL